MPVHLQVPSQSAEDPEGLPLVLCGMRASAASDAQEVPAAPHSRRPRVPALAVAEQVSFNTGPHLVRLVHGQRLADVSEQPPGAFEVTISTVFQSLSCQPQLLTPLGRVLLEAPWRCPVGVKSLPHVALQRTLDRVHGSEQPLQASALAITIDHKCEHDDADLLRPLPQRLLARTSKAAAGSWRSGADRGGSWLSGHVH